MKKSSGTLSEHNIHIYFEITAICEAANCKAYCIVKKDSIWYFCFDIFISILAYWIIFGQICLFSKNCKNKSIFWHIVWSWWLTGRCRRCIGVDIHRIISQIFSSVKTDVVWWWHFRFRPLIITKIVVQHTFCHSISNR